MNTPTERVAASHPYPQTRYHDTRRLAQLAAERAGWVEVRRDRWQAPDGRGWKLVAAGTVWTFDPVKRVTS